ncbi:MAG: phasin family protein [Bdellovibrionales bacterium]
MTRTTEQMEKTTQGLIKACDEMGTNCSKSVDAVVEATSAVSKGCEEFSRKWGDLVQESVARTLAAGKTMMNARSLKEISDLQTEFMKECFDTWLAGTSRLSEISARTTQEAFEPVARHASDTMNKAARQAQSGRAA